MNNFENIPPQGAANPKLMADAHRMWFEAAAKCGVDMTGFDLAAPFGSRIAWALQRGLEIGLVYTRYSTKLQGSTEDQVRACVTYAATHGIYVPPECLCVDEATKGRKTRREGLDRAKALLAYKYAKVLLVFKLSRLFRQAYKGVQFFREQLVDERLRGISVSEGVDTADQKSWRLQVALRGAMDEELLFAISDHVREGLFGLFLKNWTTGALPIGYIAKEVPGGPLTRRKLPRMMPAVDEAVAALIRKHFSLIAEGMDIRAGWRLWLSEGGPSDKRSITKTMSYNAYHRMLSREAYIGRWQFGRKRNSWSAKRDGIQQTPQPEDQVKLVECPELRIVSDEVFYRVQQRLNAMKTGPRTRKNKREHAIWDLTIGLFACPHCLRRFHMVGAKGQYMHCPNATCPAPAMVHREHAVKAVCQKLDELLRQDDTLIDQIVASFGSLDEHDHDTLDLTIAERERDIRSLSSRIADLDELLGSGSDEDRQRRKAQIRATESQRSALQADLAGLRQRRGGGKTEPVTREQVIAQIQNLAGLLNDAACGHLGQDVVGKALDIFRSLVGGRIDVHATRRPGRQRWTATGIFTPGLINTVREALKAPNVAQAIPTKSVEVILVPLPFVDQIADEVRHLYEVERKGFRVINNQLEAKYGKKIGSGNICSAWRRWYQIRNLPLPPKSTTTGRPRKAG